MRADPSLDPVTIEPDVLGEFSKAWKVDARKRMDFAAKAGLDTSHDAGVALWLVEAPWAHPFWHSYMLTLIHLRPLPGVPEARIMLPGATHEMWLHALDTSTKRTAVIAQGHPPRPLQPMNFGAQIIAETDEAAAARIEDAVRRICAGTLSPDTDFIRQWIALFGGNMVIGEPDCAINAEAWKKAAETRTPEEMEQHAKAMMQRPGSNETGH